MTSEVAGLVQSLASKDSAQRQAAAGRLAQLGSFAQEAAVALVEALVDDDGESLESIVAALEELGPPQASDVGKLAVLVQHKSLDPAYWAATLLGRLESKAAAAVDRLAATLAGHPEMAVRQRSAWALGRIGRAAGAARQALEEAAASTDRRLASLAREALDQITRAERI